MTDNIFTPPTGEPQIDPNKNYLEELVGEGKKFKDAEALAKGKYFADQMVEFKNKEYDRLREDYLKLKGELDTRATLEDLLTKMKAPETPHTQEAPEAKPFDPKQVKEIFYSEFQEIERSRKEQSNKKLVEDKLIERYGPNYGSVVNKQLDSLGLTAEFAEDLAKRAPQALLKTLGLDQPHQQQLFQTPPNSSARTDMFAPSSNQVRGWSYYEKLRVEKPAIYTDPKTQVQMHNDLLAQGEEKFYAS